MSTTDAPPAYVTEAEVQSVLQACRVLSGVSARSVAAQQRVDPADLRILLAIAQHGSVTEADLATGDRLPRGPLDRVLARLAAAGLIGHAEDDAMTLTPRGRQLIATAIQRRRQALELVARQLPPLRRLEVSAVFGLLDFEPNHSQKVQLCDGSAHVA
jgi:DNA-binding MarR family transcriptional regulator